MAAPILQHESRPLKNRCFGRSRCFLLNLFFLAKDDCTINFTVFFSYICICNRVRSVSLSDGGLRDRDNIQRWKFCFLSCLVKFPAREANSWRRRASSNPGNWVCLFFFFSPSYRFSIFSRSNAHTHTNNEGAKTRGKAERRQRAVHFTRFLN